LKALKGSGLFDDATTVWFERYDYDYRQRLTTVANRNRDVEIVRVIRYEYDGLDRRQRRTVTKSI